MNQEMLNYLDDDCGSLLICNTSWQEIHFSHFGPEIVLNSVMQLNGKTTHVYIQAVGKILIQINDGNDLQNKGHFELIRFLAMSYICLT